MADKKNIGLVCKFKNEFVRENDVYVDESLKTITSQLLGESVAKKYLQEPKVIAYVGEDYYLTVEKVLFVSHLQEFARMAGGKEMAATKFDEVFREWIQERVPRVWTYVPSLSLIGGAVGKMERRIKKGRWLRKRGIQRSDPIAFVETKKKRMGKHKAWFSDEVIDVWSERCENMEGTPWTNEGKVAKKAVELNLSESERLERAPEVSAGRINPCPSGNMVKFLERYACDLDNFDGVKVMSYTREPNELDIVATYDDGTRVHITTDTLIRFMKEMNPEEICSASVCEYRI